MLKRPGSARLLDRLEPGDLLVVTKGPFDEAKALQQGTLPDDMPRIKAEGE